MQEKFLQHIKEAEVIPQIMCKAARIVHTGTVEYNYFVRENSLTTGIFLAAKIRKERLGVKKHGK